MKKLAVTLALAFISSSSAFSKTPPASPLLGSWNVDVSRLPVPADARPKSVTMTFSKVPAGKWQTKVDIVAPDGSVRAMTSTYSLDGASVPIEGDRMEADTAAVRMPSPDVLVLALAKGKTPASTRIYKVLTGGTQMVETTVYFDESGKAVMRTNYFSRAR